MKRIILLCIMILAWHPARAQLPVTDVASILQQIKGYALEVKQAAVQAQQLATQALQYKQEVEQFIAFVHDPSFGAAMGYINQAGLGDALPVNPYALQQLIGGHSGLMGKVNALGNLANESYAQNHVYSPTDGSWNSQQLIANGNSIAGVQGAALAAYQDMRAHVPIIQALRDRLMTATTPKDVADAHAQLAVETLWMHNLNSQLSAIEVNYRAQQDARVQRDNETLTKGIDTFLAQAKAAGRGL